MRPAYRLAYWLKGFATKPALAVEMITRALDTGVTAGWVAGDEVCGGDSKLREALEGRGIGYVLAVACSHQTHTQVGKTLAGLDQHQVRRWTSWHRWTILTMLAYAFLAVTAATEHAENPTTQESSLIALTCNEIKHLFNTLLANPIRDLRHRLRWSTWRRRHQHRSRTSHYQRRQTLAA